MYTYRRKRDWHTRISALVIAVFVGAGILGIIAGLEKTRSVTITVTDKAPSTDSKPYRIFTEQGETFSIKDTFWHWRFNSSDLYGKLRVGKTYKCDAFWVRIPWPGGSTYRNLLNCDEVASDLSTP